jgi:hypothetical protein
VPSSCRASFSVRLEVEAEKTALLCARFLFCSAPFLSYCYHIAAECLLQWFVLSLPTTAHAVSAVPYLAIAVVEGRLAWQKSEQAGSRPRRRGSAVR